MGIRKFGVWLGVAAIGWVVPGPGRGDDVPSPRIAAAVARSPEDCRAAVERVLAGAEANAPELAAAILEAPDDEQRAAVAFLVAHLPPVDRTTLTKAYLLEDVACAFEARRATAWAARVPLELFLNDVLPPTSVNERRDAWRRDFLERFLPVARAAPDASAAANQLNSAVFEAFGVRYHATKRPKPDQSPYESAKVGYASCTGLSILLIDACRAVGIPARLVGTPQWTNQSGNHTWVEIWDREWKFIGACEAGRFNEGWFTDQAAAADESTPAHRIYATSYAADPAATHFPMVWRRGDASYPAEDVTRRYTRRRRATFRLPDGAAPARVTVRRDGRIVAQDHLAPAATFELPGDTTYQVEVRREGASAGTTRAVHLSAEADQVVSLEPA